MDYALQNSHSPSAGFKEMRKGEVWMNQETDCTHKQRKPAYETYQFT